MTRTKKDEKYRRYNNLRIYHGLGKNYFPTLNSLFKNITSEEKENIRPLESNPISADMPHPFGLRIGDEEESVKE